MKLLLDQDVYADTARFLNELGHGAVPVAQVGLAQAGDADLLMTAQDQGRIFITRDRDFGDWYLFSGWESGLSISDCCHPLWMPCTRSSAGYWPSIPKMN